MKTENYNDLLAFVTVANARSFTRAAAQLGVSRSALSHAMSALESRLGVRLLSRTTRSVATTEAGALLLATLAPRFAEINDELALLSALRDKPAGIVRITHRIMRSQPCSGPDCCRCCASTPISALN